MARGVFTTVATTIALALGVNVSAFEGQHGHAGAPEHPAQPNAHGNSTASTTGASGASTSGKTSTTTTTATTTTGTGTTSGGTTANGTTTTPLSPVQQKLSTHTQLAGRLQSRLGSGTNVITAASGFRNLGQFVAAVNVSHNLGIPFAQLKTDMVTKHLSLGQSIKALRPATTTTTATHEAEQAETEATHEIDVDAKTTTTKSTTTTKKGDK